MKALKKLFLTVAVVALGPVVWAQEVQPEPQKSSGDDSAPPMTSVLPHMETLDNVTNRISYALGINTARNLKYNLPDAHLDFFVLALREEFAGNPPRLNEQEINAAIAEFSKMAQRRQENRIDNAAEDNLRRAERFLEANGKKEGVVTTESGLQYLVLADGSGDTPTKDSVVRISLTTKLMDGRIIESTAAPGRPKSVTVDLKKTIPAWEEALTNMKLGAKWEVYAHPRLAYGEKGADNVAPNELLIFRIEVLAFH